MARYVYLIGVAGLLFMFSAISLQAHPNDKETIACFVVLDSPSALEMQYELSGCQSAKSALFKSKQAEAYSYALTLESEQTSIVEQILWADQSANVRQRFTRLVNAISLDIDPEKMGALREIPGVAYIAPVRRYKPLLTTSGAVMNVAPAWQKFDAGKNAGEGVFIAFIDTGLDITHPAFDGTGFQYPEGFPKGETDYTNGKVIVSRVFPEQGTSNQDTTLYDLEGHGTHVASIAAANFDIESPLGTLSGVAPRAYVGNYKVFTSDYTTNEQIISAIEAAVEDGADVINMSLGNALFSNPYHDLLLRAVRSAIDLGATVVVAAGNDGEEYSIGGPAQVDEAISVGAVTNAHYPSSNDSSFDLLVTVTADGETILEDSDANVGSEGGPYVEPMIGTFSIVDVDLLDGGSYGGTSDGLACDTLEDGVTIDGWVLVQRGDCTFVSKVENMTAAGAKGVLIFDNKTTLQDAPIVTGTSIPAIMISKSAGETIKAALLEGKEVIIDIHGEPALATQVASNRLVSYSSIGPSVLNSIKPDVVAVGDAVYAAAQNDDANQSSFYASGFQWLSGTSMSSPHVAGLAAVLKQIHPDWSPAWIKSAITMGANYQVQLENNASRQATILQCGAGSVDAGAAMDVDTICVPSLLGFGVLANGVDHSEPQWITVANPLDVECSYTLTPQSVNGGGVADISEPAFTLAPGAKLDIEITLTSLSAVTQDDHEGALKLANLTTGTDYRIPYWFRMQGGDTAFGSVLLVDNDGGASYEDYYMGLLDSLGVDYTSWDVNNLGDYPSLDTMKQYPTILWAMGETSLNSIPDESSTEYWQAYNPRETFELELMQYLAEGGSLFLSGQDYFDDKESSVFSSEALMVNMLKRDGGASRIQGLIGSPISEDLTSTFTLAFPAGYNNFVDFLGPVDSAQTLPAFIADGNTSRVVGTTAETCTYRAVFLAFPLEVLSTNAGSAILQRSLTWLQEMNTELSEPQVTDVSPAGINTIQETGPYALEINGEGFVYRGGYRAWLDFTPLTSVVRQSCTQITASIPDTIAPGTYTLHVVTGDGHRISLTDAVTISDDPGTPIPEWTEF